jgi:hypothetical protein
MSTVYLAGPMSGYPDFNRAAFRTAAELLREEGFIVTTPADCFHGDSWEEGMRRDIPAMLACDQVCLLGEWEKSRGARLEVFIAREVGMKVETLDELLLSLPTKPLEEVRRELREKHDDVSSESVN